jgi:glycosyltransferase involved in cell wall biosynthesis
VSTEGTCLTVLTPSFGYNRYLAACIGSTRGYEGVEQVVVDGGSTDGTVESLAELAASHQSLRWVSEPDKGQSDALNKALALARGSIVGWLNVDEFYLPRVLDEVMGYFTTHPETDVLFGDAAVTDEDGRYESLLGQHVFSSSVLRSRCFIPTCTFFVRRSALDGWQFDTGLRVVMDWDLYCWLSHRGATFGYLGHAVAGFRSHPAQVTASGHAASRSEWPVLNARYGVEPWALRPRRLQADVSHAWLKLRSGAYRRELRLRALRGESIDWATGDGAALARAEYLARLR